MCPFWTGLMTLATTWNTWLGKASTVMNLVMHSLKNKFLEAIQLPSPLPAATGVFLVLVTLWTLSVIFFCHDPYAKENYTSWTAFVTGRWMQDPCNENTYGIINLHILKHFSLRPSRKDTSEQEELRLLYRMTQLVWVEMKTSVSPHPVPSHSWSLHSSAFAAHLQLGLRCNTLWMASINQVV